MSESVSYTELMGLHRDELRAREDRDCAYDEWKRAHSQWVRVQAAFAEKLYSASENVRTQYFNAIPLLSPSGSAYASSLESTKVVDHD